MGNRQTVKKKENLYKEIEIAQEIQENNYKTLSNISHYKKLKQSFTYNRSLNDSKHLTFKGLDIASQVIRSHRIEHRKDVKNVSLEVNSAMSSKDLLKISRAIKRRPIYLESLKLHILDVQAHRMIFLNTLQLIFANVDYS